MLAAGLAGAAFDEWHHLGLHAWLSLCAAGGLSLGTMLSLQWQLLPTLWIGMAVAAVAQWAWMLASSTRHWPGSLGIGHAACFAGMVACGWLCPYLIRPEAGRAGAWLALLCAEAMVLVAVTFATAIVKRLVESVRTFRLSPATAD